MALWPAGSKFTSGKLEDLSAIVTLTDLTVAATGDQQWGTEYVAFDNPGVECVVTAILTGRTLARSPGGQQGDTVTIYTQISFDGGSTWTSGSSLAYNDCPIGGTATNTATTTFRVPFTVKQRAQAVPTGQIRVRAMVKPGAAGSATGQRFSTGEILATLTGA